MVFPTSSLGSDDHLTATLETIAFYRKCQQKCRQNAIPLPYPQAASTMRTWRKLHSPHAFQGLCMKPFRIIAAGLFLLNLSCQANANAESLFDPARHMRVSEVR